MNRILIFLLLALTACTDPIYMKSQKTAEIAKCGPYWTGLASDFKLDGIATMEAQCINDYKEQGFVRVSGVQ